jgi:hypothetical protein
LLSLSLSLSLSHVDGDVLGAAGAGRDEAGEGGVGGRDDHTQALQRKEEQGREKKESLGTAEEGGELRHCWGRRRAQALQRKEESSGTAEEGGELRHCRGRRRAQALLRKEESSGTAEEGGGGERVGGRVE